MTKIIPVILCGGSGTRLWPLSRTDIPKQFLKLLDNHTLLQKTVLRTLSITGAPESELVIVTLDTMLEETRRQLREISPGLTAHILTEPQARNTAAAVAFAAQYIRKTFGDDTAAWVLPSDHYVGDEDNLALALYEALAIAQEEYLITFGIRPTRPETGYGYIRRSTKIKDTQGYNVSRFVEKPTHEVAEQYISTGAYLWSSGMHVFTLDAVEQAFRRHAPDIWECVTSAIMHGSSLKKPAAAVYALARKEPFETAVIEKADKVAVIPCDPKWSDIGSWESLWEIKPKNEQGNSLNGRIVCEETVNSFIIAQNRLVTCIGVKDIVVIETGDSVLVADRRCNGSMKKLIAKLHENGHKEIRSALPEVGVAA